MKEIVLSGADGFHIGIRAPDKVQLTLTFKSSYEAAICYQDLIEAAAAGRVQITFGVVKGTVRMIK